MEAATYTAAKSLSARPRRLATSALRLARKGVERRGSRRPRRRRFPSAPSRLERVGQCMTTGRYARRSVTYTDTTPITATQQEAGNVR